MQFKDFQGGQFMEKVRVFNEHFTVIGEDTRDNVHLKGKWHETFHCWFVDQQYVYIQKRSADKKDFPSLYDITAAGHLEAYETVEDGVREIEEELGISVLFSDLKKVGVVKDKIIQPWFLDYEFAHVFLYEGSFQPTDFTLQKDEVEGIYKVQKLDFARLCLQEVGVVEGEHLTTRTMVPMKLTDFVPHETIYFQLIGQVLSL